MQNKNNGENRECSMELAVFIALQKRNVYNRRCQPPENKHINDFKPQRGVTKLGSYAPVGLMSFGVVLSAGYDATGCGGGYRHFAPFGARKLQLACYTLYFLRTLPPTYF